MNAAAHARPRPRSATAQPRRPRTAAPPRAVPPVVDRGARNRRRPADAVRPSGLHRPVEPARGLPPARVDRALEDRSVVQATVMRATIHMVSAADYWPFALATRPSREQWYLRAAATLLRGVDMDRAVRRVRADLSDGPRRHDELIAGLAEEGIPRTAWNGVAQLSTSSACRHPERGNSGGRTATPSPSSGWVSRRSTSRPRSSTSSGATSRGSGRPAGPMSRAGPGCRQRALKPAFEALDLRRFRDADGRELIDLAGRAAARRRRPRTRPLLPDLGRQPADPRPPGRDPARGLPAAHLQHEDAALLPDLPGRRRRSPARGGTRMVA